MIDAPTLCMFKMVKKLKALQKKKKKKKLGLNKTIEKKKPFKFHQQNIFPLLLFKKKIICTFLALLEGKTILIQLPYLFMKNSSI